jgi:hypothetical protein
MTRAAELDHHNLPVETPLHGCAVVRPNEPPRTIPPDEEPQGPSLVALTTIHSAPRCPPGGSEPAFRGERPPAPGPSGSPMRNLSP